MRKAELDIRGSHKVINLEGREVTVLVRWYFDKHTAQVKIVEILDGKCHVEAYCGGLTRARLIKEIRKEYMDGCYRRVAELAGNQTLFPGGLG